MSAAGRIDFVGKLIGVFLGDMDRRLGRIRVAWARPDIEALRMAARALKGASAEIGARRLAHGCAQLELADKPAP